MIADGFIWGRGALDDKASVIATLEAIEVLLAQQYQPQRSLYFSFAHDEEIGGAEGAANISAHLKQAGVQLAYMIGEGGLVVENNPLLKGKTMAMVALAEKTYITLTLHADGDGGHSSTPPKNNAVIRLARAVTALHENPFEPQLVKPVAQRLEVVGPHIGGIQGFLFANQWLTKPVLLAAMADDRTTNALVRTTTAVTMFDAGIKENVISQKAQAKVNFRLLPGFTPEQLIVEVTEIIDDPSIKIESDQWKTSPPMADMHTEGYKRIEQSINHVLPEAVVAPGMLMASTDTPHYIGVAEQIYRFHPHTMPMEDAASIHATNERVGVEAMVQAVQVSQQLIQNAARP